MTRVSIISIVIVLCLSIGSTDAKNISKENINAKDKYGKTALINAVRGGQIKLVKVLLARGADIDAKSDTGSTALIYAALDRYNKIVELLLAKGADVNAKNNSGSTALMHASRNGSIASVKILLAKGADVNAVYADLGYTALIEAAANGHVKVVEMLLAKGAKVNAKDNTGKTALMYAKMRKRIKVVAVLENNIISKAAISQKSAKREWLILVYMSGVNDLGVLGYVDKSINAMESVKLTNKISVVVKYNGINTDKNKHLQFQGDSVKLHIRHDSDINKINSPAFRSKYNSDMGNYKHLCRFAISNILRFPAKKIMLIIWGRGNGYKGIAYDDTSNNHISVKQLGLALAKITKRTGRKLDVFATDASFMQMASVAGEIEDYTKVIIGSEESVPGQGYPYKSILTNLASNPGIDAKGLANIIIKNYGDYYSDKGITVSAVKNYGNRSYSGRTTLSAIDTASMPRFVKLLNNWVNAIISSADDSKKVAKLALSKNAPYFGPPCVNKAKYTRSIDLCNFIDRVDKVLPDESKAKEAGKILRDFITENLIISHREIGRENTQTYGLAVYMPKRIDGRYNELIFARKSHWDDFVRATLIIHENPK